jgi:hypothetical protein
MCWELQVTLAVCTSPRTPVLRCTRIQLVPYSTPRLPVIQPFVHALFGGAKVSNGSSEIRPIHA